MRSAGHSVQDVALGMKLTSVGQDEAGKALTAAKFQKNEIAPALAYAGYKR